MGTKEVRMGPLKKRIRIKYEYSVVSNSIRILNGVEISCWDTPSSRGHWHKSMLESSASWPYASICFYLISDLTMKTTSYSCQTYPHISYVTSTYTNTISCNLSFYQNCILGYLDNIAKESLNSISQITPHTRIL